MSQPEHDFTVFTQKKTISVGENGRTVEGFKDEPTSLQVTEKVKAAIQTIPDLERFKIFDGPFWIRLLSYGHRPIPKNRSYWYVHYSTKSADNLMCFGPGKVQIIDRETGAVVYDGTDGGE